MPHWAFHRLGCLSLALLVSGCAYWPSQEHRDVTLDGISNVLAEHKQTASCDAKSITRQLEIHTGQMEELSKQVQSLRAANPTFVNSVCPPAEPSTRYDDRLIVGSTEWVYLTPPGEYFLARVDSGAATSSISAQNITPFERNGKKWVRFVIAHGDDSRGAEVEAPQIRTVVVRQASSAEGERRSVVMLTINLGSIQQEAEFTLTDRSQMTFPMLLGREFLQDLVLIDVGRTNVQPKFVPSGVSSEVPKNGARIPADKPLANKETVEQTKKAADSTLKPTTGKPLEKQQESVLPNSSKTQDKVDPSVPKLDVPDTVAPIPAS